MEALADGVEASEFHGGLGGEDADVGRKQRRGWLCHVEVGAGQHAELLRCWTTSPLESGS